MTWDLLEEHEIVYGKTQKNSFINSLCDLFDDIYEYTYKSSNRWDIYVDVFQSENDMCMHMKEILLKYLDIFYENEELRKIKRISSQEAFLCELICTNTLKGILLNITDFVEQDKKYLAIIDAIVDNINQLIGVYEAELYVIKDYPAVLTEIFPDILFAKYCIRYGDYIFMILFGTSD